MTITQFIQRLLTHVPSDWTYYATGQASNYNQESTPADVVLVELPRWPAKYRQMCAFEVNVQVYVGKLVNLIPAAGTEVHAPYHSTEVIAAMHAAFDQFLDDVNTDNYMQVLTASPLEYIDAASGFGVNSQAWMRSSVQLRLWPEPAPLPDPEPEP